MDKWVTLEPVKLYGQASGSTWLSRNSSKPVPPTLPKAPLIGRLPADLHLLVLTHLPIPDIPAYSRSSFALARLTADEKLWERKWASLGVEANGLDVILDELDSQSKLQVGAARSTSLPVLDADDEFGDFASAPISFTTSGTEDLADFVISSSPTTASNIIFSVSASAGVFKTRFMRAHALLAPLTKHLTAAPHLVLSSLFPPSLSLRQQSKTLRLLAQYLSPRVQPLRAWKTLLSSLRSTIDRFQAHLLTAFDIADRKRDENAMREAAWASWEVWDGVAASDEWEMGRVWAEKREIFYEQGKWRPLQNFT